MLHLLDPRSSEATFDLGGAFTGRPVGTPDIPKRKEVHHIITSSRRILLRRSSTQFIA
jgi:hypothetical protein